MNCSLPDFTIKLPAGSIGPSSRKLAPILGGIFGAIAGLILISVGIFLFLRRRRKQGANDGKTATEAYAITPFKEEIHPLMPDAMGSTTLTPLSKRLTTDLWHSKKMQAAMNNSTEPRNSFGDNSVQSSTIVGSTRRTDAATPHSDDLRREVEYLRMEMEALKGQQPHLSDEPPPSYN